jgi:uncharacterized membrane protein YbhN (UPF0104 family)
MRRIAEMGQGNSRAVLLAIKGCVAIILLWLIASKIDWSHTWQQFRAAGPTLVFIVFAILLLNVFLSAFKWGLLLRIHRVFYSLRTLSAYYFVAIFFSNFLPSSIGGDGYRIYKTLDNERGKTSAVVAVLMERLTGIGVLLVLGFVAAQTLPGTPRGITLAFWAIAIGVLVGPWLGCFLRSRLPGKLRLMTDTLAEHAGDYAQRPQLALAVIGLSAMFHLMLAFAYYLAISNTGSYEAGLLELLVALAVSNLVAVLPISINGIGVFEGAFMYLLSQYGVPYEVSAIPMILNRVLLVPLSVIGAVLYFGARYGGLELKRAST